MNNNHLIFGKDNTQRIISIEDRQDGTVDIYTQEVDGTVNVKSELNEYWILTSEAADELSVQLEGNGYYKYKNNFTLKEEFDHAKKHFRKFKDKCYWVNDQKEAFMMNTGHTYFKGLKQQEVSTLAFDIETTTLDHNKDAKLLLISNTFRDHKGSITRKLFSYDEYKNEKEFIDAWCAWVRQVNPGIMLGHNIFGFDFMYLDFIARRAGTRLFLGRQKEALRFNNWESKFRKDGSQFIDYTKCYISGREIVDTFFLAIKYDIGRKYESYGLKPIIKHEGLEVEGRVFYDASQIRNKYKDSNEWALIKQYAMFDADDAMSLWDLMGPSFFYMTLSVPKSFQEMICSASGSQLNAMMVRNYLQENHSLPKASEAAHFEGAISIGNPGIYKNAKKFDVASLYPSIMIQYQVYDEVKDPKGYFKEMVNTFTQMRLQNKKLAKTDKYYDDLQSAQKVFINSAYGFLGAQGLLFNSPVNAAFVTEKGREILNVSFEWAEENNLTIINADTDSLTVAKPAGEPMSPEEQVSLLNSLQSKYPDKIKWEDDGYYPALIVLAAKNYILYDGKKIKTKGSSLRDQKKEAGLREFLDKIINMMIHDQTNFTEVYDTYIREILNITEIKRWSSKKTLTTAVYNSPRANETKVLAAVQGTEYKEADKVWLFFKSDESLCLAEKFDGDYNKKKLLEKLYKVSLVFEPVLPVKELFLNYALKRNAKFLDSIAGTDARAS